MKSHPKRGASVKEPSQLPERQVKEERRHRHFDCLKCAVQTEEINPDFDSYKSQTTLCYHNVLEPDEQRLTKASAFNQWTAGEVFWYWPKSFLALPCKCFFSPEY